VNYKPFLTKIRKSFSQQNVFGPGDISNQDTQKDFGEIKAGFDTHPYDKSKRCWVNIIGRNELAAAFVPASIIWSNS
jgi:hypothetical protein